MAYVLAVNGNTVALPSEAMVREYLHSAFLNLAGCDPDYVPLADGLFRSGAGFTP